MRVRALILVAALAAVSIGARLAVNPHPASACVYVADKDLRAEALAADGVAVVVAGDRDEATDLVPVAVRQWFGRRPGIPDEFPANVPSQVCYGPNSLKSGHEYLLLFEYLKPRRKSGYIAGVAPWWTFEVRDGRLFEVPWEGSGRTDAINGGPSPLDGRTLVEAITVIQPYRDLLVAVESPPAPAHEWDSHTLRLDPFGRGPAAGDLESVLSSGGRIAIGRVADSTAVVTREGPRTRQRIEVERWLFRPPDQPVTSFTVMQRGVGWGRWTLIDPSDSLMHAGERYLMFWRGGDSDHPELRFRIENGVLRPATTGWFNPTVADVFIGLTEDEAVARIQDCLVLAPKARAGGRPAVTDTCAGSP